MHVREVRMYPVKLAKYVLVFNNSDGAYILLSPKDTTYYTYDGRKKSLIDI